MPSKNYVKALCLRVVKSLPLIHISAYFSQNLCTVRVFIRRIVSSLLALLLSISCMMAIITAALFAPSPFSILQPTSAYAADNVKDLGIVATDSITDTENLLGDSVTKVSDAIVTTKKRTGVNVKLLYLATFGNTKNPAKWASDLLISTMPARNTVLLAVATHDGRLIVAVSPNSDEWLKSKNTVDALSDAAYRPLVTTSGSHWEQSAMMMMQQIARSKRTSTSTSASLVSTLVMLVVLLAVCAIVTAILLRRRYVQRQIRAGLRKAHRRHARTRR